MTHTRADISKLVEGVMRLGRSDPMVVCAVEPSGEEIEVAAATLPTYTMRCCHGTTVFWVRISPSHLLIGVDSRAVVKCSALGHPRTYESLESEEAKKFIEIFDNVFATLAGDSGRCESMIEYIDERMRKKKSKYTLSEIAEIATEFFENHPMDRAKHVNTLVYLCSWISSTNEYVVIPVGDDIKTVLPIPMDVKVFATGCGSELAKERLEELFGLRAPRANDAKILVHELLKASIRYPYTGGSLKVYSLKDNVCTCVYKTSLEKELYNHNQIYEYEVFENTNMLVIVRATSSQFLSPQDLVTYVERFDPLIEVGDITWLCHSDNLTFLAYLVKMSSEECCEKWYESYTVSTGPFRVDLFQNSDNSICSYAVAHARREALDLFRKIKSFPDLTT